MPLSAEHYHLEELRIARDAGDPRRSLPPIEPHHRRILDVGCGAGQTLIASDLSDDVLACGIDLDADALALGKRLDARLQLVRGGGEHLPFASQYFDLVVSRVALPYMHIDRALAEMARVLRTGGDVWLTLHPLDKTWDELRGDLHRLRAKALIHRAYVLANGALLHFTGALAPIPWRRERYESFQTERSMRRALQRAGFAEISSDRRVGFVVRARKLR